MDLLRTINGGFQQCFSEASIFKKAQKTSDINKNTGELITKVIPKAIKDYLNDDHYLVKGSIGVGLATKTPWIAIMNKDITTSTRNGVYIVFLFSTDFQRVYLTFNQGTTVPGQFGQRLNRKTVLSNTNSIRGLLNISNTFLNTDDNADIADELYRIGAICYSVWDTTDIRLCEKMLDQYLDLYNQYSIMKTQQQASYTSRQSDSSMTSDTLSNNYKQNGYTPIQKIYFGTPGGGKSNKVKTLIEVTKKAKDRCFRTTFHPDTDYASFVGSYKPVMKGELICYKYVPQVFTLSYISAWNDPDNEYFLVIEEINRGNCAQIFGDLFQLLDRDKVTGYSEFPIQADSDLAEYLLYAKDEEGDDILSNKEGIENKKLCLPPNLSIVATMNTSDQSLFPMDSAFKRRWDWEFVPSAFNEKDNFNITIGNKVYKWHTFLKEANARIKQATDSEDKQMGSYFIKTDMDEEKFKSKVMYYLWSEICKEEYKTQNNFFRYIDKDINEQEFTFNELYAEGSDIILQKFMKFLKVQPVTGEDTDVEEDRDNQEP